MPKSLMREHRKEPELPHLIEHLRNIEIDEILELVHIEVKRRGIVAVLASPPSCHLKEFIDEKRSKDSCIFGGEMITRTEVHEEHLARFNDVSEIEPLARGIQKPGKCF